MVEAATITAAAAALRGGSTTSVALTTAALTRADRLDDALGCYLRRFDSQAMRAAREADEAFARGVDRGPLQGIPLALKDLISTREAPTTAQSPVFGDRWRGAPDAAVAARLRAQGAILLGKVSLNEFAVGFPHPDAGFPIPVNPWSPDRWPGGSSSGTAVGVAAGLFLGGLGTDTGGSVRIPAALCGITGLKPTYGRVPNTGIVPLAYSLDTVGAMARSARDCAALLEAIAGPDPADSATHDGPDLPLRFEGPRNELDGVRIGVERRHYSALAGVDRDVVNAFEASLRVLAEAGAVIDEVELDRAELATTASSVIMRAEALAYHHRDLRRRWHEYGSVTRHIFAHGALQSSADYVQAQRFRRVVCGEVNRVLEGVDVIATPTVGVTAPTFDADFVALIPMFFTGIWNLTGFPAMSLPAGFSAAGLPVGLQLGAAAHQERSLVHVGSVLQQRTDWHLQHPPVHDGGGQAAGP